MKYSRQIIFFLSIFCFHWNSLAGQTVLPPSRMEVYMRVANDDSSIVFNSTHFSSQSKLLGTVLVKLQDTLHVAKIKVRLGTTQGGSDIFTKDFLFDVEGNFPDGTSYHRIGNKILLGIGQFIGLNSYYTEVSLEDNSQNLSVPVYYNMNGN